ncbi:MAG: O-antigen ligase family protein [Armatimonadetes bacterium]|nr:O-antigen ligase family protein [Armatimonadota bacterium]
MSISTVTSHPWAKVKAKLPSGTRWEIVLASILGILVLVAFPAPKGVGAAEVLMALVAFVLFLHFLLIRQNFARASGLARPVGWALFAHVAGWMITAAVGVTQGVDTMGIVRSLLPQILFAPVALVGLSLSGPVEGRSLGRILAGIGVFHALYLVGLGIFAYSGAGSASDLVISRITFIDPRTTMPLFLALAPFGLAAVATGRLRAKLWGLAAILLCLAGALVTQTRAQILAVVAGVLLFGIVYVASRPTPTVLVTTLVIIGLGMATIAAVPPLRNLAMAVLERQQKVGDNARLDNEWLPALTQWEMRGTPAVIGGIGLGVPIKDFSGEEKTYIHNQTIYFLVYGGLVGFVLIMSLYAATFFTLLVRYIRKREILDLAAASTLVSLWLYAQFFAVHKLFSFTLMLFVLVAIALRGNARPDSPPLDAS